MKKSVSRETGRAGGQCAAAPTFNKDIAPILYENCATCHRPGEVAPFSLLTYQDAAKRASLIATRHQETLHAALEARAGLREFRP